MYFYTIEVTDNNRLVRVSVAAREAIDQDEFIRKIGNIFYKLFLSWLV